MTASPGGFTDAEREEAAYHHDQSKKATASGWIGSALEYYDFFIYAQAAALVFPQLFFDPDHPQMAIIGALGTYGVGYIMRPIGAFVLGYWGDRYGRKNVLVLCMLLMGFATIAVAFLPTYSQVGFIAPVLLLLLRLVQGFAVAGEISGASSMISEHAPFGRRGFLGSFTLQGTQAGQILAAAVFLPLATWLPHDAFMSWGWRIPFLLSIVVIVAGFIIRRRVDETPVFKEEIEEGEIAKSPITEVFQNSGGTMFRVFCMALMNIIPVTTSIFGATYAVQAAYGINFDPGVYLWIPVLGNIVAVILIPFVGNLSDKIGRRPCIMFAALLTGFMSYGYLWAIHEKSVPLAIFFSLVMWGATYQGYNAIFPSYYPELFPARYRVSGMAISQNFGTMVSSLMPMLFAVVAPGGSNVVLIVGSLTLGMTLISFVAAYFSKETYRIESHELGEPDAVPLSKEEYDRRRAETLAQIKAMKAAR